MGGDPGRLRKEEIRSHLLSCGADAVGFARIAPTVDSDSKLRRAWIDRGHHAGMDYMARNTELRTDPEGLLPGARTLISMAFSFKLPAEIKKPKGIAGYALLYDYHDAIREMIRNGDTGSLLGMEHKDWRLCVDSAPLAERYWAMKAGIGTRCRNGMVSVPGSGAEVFLAEILSVMELEPDEESKSECSGCGRCLQACPTGALQTDGTVDADRCLSYLTIEHRGEWQGKVQIEAMQTAAAKETLFGCDRCVVCCPLASKAENYSKIKPHQGALSLDGEILAGMDALTFSQLLKGSPLKRAKLAGLKRNSEGL